VVYFAESRRATYFYQILYYQVLYRTDFLVLASACRLCVPRNFLPRPPRGRHVCSCLRVGLGRRRHKSVCALCRGVCRLLRGVHSSVCRHVVAGFLAAFPFSIPFPVTPSSSYVRGHAVQCVTSWAVCSSVSACQLFSLAYFMMSLYLILTVKMLLFTLVFRYATAVNFGIMYTH